MEFAEPDIRFHESYVAAFREFRTLDAPPSPFARHELDLIESPAAFAAFVAQLRADPLPDTPRPDWKVPQTTLWWVDGDEFIGRLAIRHSLTPALRRIGGHIGYDVRPSRRREGHASRMLAAALPVATSLGIDRVLLTCDDDNIGSRKVIEKNGGVLEDASLSKPPADQPRAASGITDASLSKPPADQPRAASEITDASLSKPPADQPRAASGITDVEDGKRRYWITL